jgi:hypothetical protein
MLDKYLSDVYIDLTEGTDSINYFFSISDFDC